LTAWSLRPPAGVARGSGSHNPRVMRSALRVTGLAAQSLPEAARWQAPRLPLAKHNGIMFPPAGRLRSCIVRRSAAPSARSGPHRVAGALAERRLNDGARHQRRRYRARVRAVSLLLGSVPASATVRHCAPGPAAGGPAPPTASVRRCPHRSAKPELLRCNGSPPAPLRRGRPGAGPWPSHAGPFRRPLPRQWATGHQPR